MRHPLPRQTSRYSQWVNLVAGKLLESGLRWDFSSVLFRVIMWCGGFISMDMFSL